ncbi:probable cytochrome P450 313a3, partial [Chironomus tepperi]|uniref:probable cytochrome P450 313a3 n=1 Tax=Chironomus tepperi TaxID=113505 RepID=UPI00391F36B9
MIGIEVLLLFGVVTLLTYCIKYFWNRRRLYELARNLPGHDGLSFIDSIKFLTQISKKDYISKLLNFIKDEAPLTKVWLFNHCFIITKDARIINKIFYTPETYNKPSLLYRIFSKNHALPSLNGNEHKRHRKIINKAFTTKILQQLLNTFDEKSKKIILKIDENVDGGEFELMDYVGVYSLESFGKSNLSYETDYFHSELFDAFYKYMESSMDFMPYLVVGLSHKLLDFLNLGGEHGKIMRSIQKYMDDVIRSNKAQDDKSENSLINLMLDPKFEFTKEEIEDELAMTTIASFDTTSRTISTILMMLG